MTRVRDLDQAVDLYLGELARRGCKRSTRAKYMDVLYPFVSLYVDLAPWEVEPDHCRRYLDRWKDSAASTLALYVSVLRAFFDFMYEEQIIEENPMARIRRPPRPRPEDIAVVTVSNEDVEKLYRAIEAWDEMLCLAALTYLGPRRTATALARRQDVDLERGTIRFREKGSKVIVKPLPTEFVAILRAAEQNGVSGSSPRTT
jgi:integrase